MKLFTNDVNNIDEVEVSVVGDLILEELVPAVSAKHGGEKAAWLLGMIQLALAHIIAYVDDEARYKTGSISDKISERYAVIKTETSNFRILFSPLDFSGTQRTYVWSMLIHYLPNNPDNSSDIIAKFHLFPVKLEAGFDLRCMCARLLAKELELRGVTLNTVKHMHPSQVLS